MRSWPKASAAKNQIAEGKQLLVRICSMLTKFVARFDSYSSSIVCEVDQAEDEDENKKEKEN